MTQAEIQDVEVSTRLLIGLADRMFTVETKHKNEAKESRKKLVIDVLKVYCTPYLGHSYEEMADAVLTNIE